MTNKWTWSRNTLINDWLTINTSPPFNCYAIKSHWSKFRQRMDGVASLVRLKSDTQMWLAHFKHCSLIGEFQILFSDWRIQNSITWLVCLKLITVSLKNNNSALFERMFFDDFLTVNANIRCLYENKPCVLCNLSTDSPVSRFWRSSHKKLLVV